VLLARQGASPRAQALGAGVWLFSPFTATISTRGNGEAVVTCMLLGMLACLQSGEHSPLPCQRCCPLLPAALPAPRSGSAQRNDTLSCQGATVAGRIVAAAALYGLAVHWRLYPILFALPLVRHLALRHLAAGGSRRRGPSGASSDSSAWRRLLRGVVSPAGAAFGAASAAVFLSLGAAMYRLYGSPFLHHTYLYHASRTDPRHNFSPFFYPAYLNPRPSTGGGGDDGELLGDSGR
jgi:phosphatidylinositol glycan class M